MFSRTLPKSFDKGRLRAWLAVFFLALAIPTAALIWQAYDQLKWEAFHQYRGLAGGLTSRVDAQLIDMIDTADAFAGVADLDTLLVAAWDFHPNAEGHRLLAESAHESLMALIERHLADPATREP